MRRLRVKKIQYISMNRVTCYKREGKWVFLKPVGTSKSITAVAPQTGLTMTDCSLSFRGTSDELGR